MCYSITRFLEILEELLLTDEQKVPANLTITVTPLAVEKLKEHAKNDNKDPGNIVLRVFVQGGGCSGFQYGLMFNEDAGGEIGAGDKTFESNGIKIVVDPISMGYLHGAKVDFVENVGGGGGLIIKNPNATSTCGCGSSFSTE